MESIEKKFFIKILSLLSLGGLGLSFFQAFRSFSLIFFLNKFTHSKSEIGFLLSLGSLIGIFAPPIIGVVSDRLKDIIKGRKLIIIFFLIFLGISISYLEKVKVLHELYVFLILTYIFFYSGMSLYQTLIPDIFPKILLARATGIINFTSQFFQGVYIFIVVISHAYNLTFTLLKWGIFLSIVFFLFIPEKVSTNIKSTLNFSENIEFLKGSFWFNLFLLQFFVWYGISSVSSFILLFFQDALSASLNDYMVVLVIFGVITALSTFFAGFIADKYSKEKLTAISLAIFGLSSFLYSQTHRLQFAFISSLVYGISLGFLTVIPYSLILSFIPKNKEGSLVGVNTLVISISQVIAYFTSGILVDFFGYRVNFLQGLISSILGLIILKRINNNSSSQTAFGK